MFRSTFTRRAAVFAIGCTLLLAGCGSKVTKDNFAKVKAGMTQQQVQDILGKGEVSEGTAASLPGIGSISAKKEVWTDGSKTITVVYANDKVATVASSGL